MTSKYDPLGDYLKARQAQEAPMTFAEIEAVIGAPLPPKAVNHPAWWSNNTSNNTMTKVWLDAGFRTERVDVGARRLVFRRLRLEPRPPGAALARNPADPAAPATCPSGARDGLLTRVRKALAGTVLVAQGVSLTAPTDEVWDAERA